MFEDDPIGLPRRGWFSQMKVGLEEVAFLGLVVLLLLLALTTFLDGYHVGWRFYLAGVLLFIYTIVAALLKAVIWIALLIAIPVVVFGLYWDKNHPLPTRVRTTGS